MSKVAQNSEDRPEFINRPSEEIKLTRTDEKITMNERIRGFAMGIFVTLRYPRFSSNSFFVKALAPQLLPRARAVFSLYFKSEIKSLSASIDAALEKPDIKKEELEKLNAEALKYAFSTEVEDKLKLIAAKLESPPTQSESPPPPLEPPEKILEEIKLQDFKSDFETANAIKNKLSLATTTSMKKLDLLIQLYELANKWPYSNQIFIVGTEKIYEEISDQKPQTLWGGHVKVQDITKANLEHLKRIRSTALEVRNRFR